ncbi:MAG TPA: nucleotidyltransferase domain-containing protein [Anaerolineae bacterium]|nr:nucleotidyltransferase domain-containing protein [Anaerolineae bacterium]
MLTDTTQHYPGTPQHQAILRAIVDHYENDPRILAVAVFGSLGRGNWDEHSDIDLDVVIADEVSLNVNEELTRLCLALEPPGEHLAVIVPDGADAGDVVFESLLQISVRYHPLATTHPNIVESLQVLTGRIDHTAIAAAGVANRRPRKPVKETLAECVRYAAVVDVALQRHHLWDTVEALHDMRYLLMDLYTLTHGGQRPWQFFQATADPNLQAQLGHTLPQYSLVSVQASLEHCLDILEHDLGHLTNEQLQLPDAYRKVLIAVRARQARLKFSGEQHDR